LVLFWKIHAFAQGNCSAVMRRAHDRNQSANREEGYKPVRPPDRSLDKRFLKEEWMTVQKNPGDIGRRDMFRIMGASGAAVLSSTVGAAAKGPQEDATRQAVSSAWREVNEMDSQRKRLWKQRMDWWMDAKFGLFVHWDPSSLASVEISWPIMRPSPKWNITEEEYVNLYKRFNPVNYDPDSWVELAKAAGQKYIVFTTKHHDGFCMFDSSFTDYKVTNTPYKKDVLMMLVEACRRSNMPLGYYYSPPDMHHPDFRDTSKPASENWRGEPTRPQWPNYLHYMQLQLRELITRYGEPEVFWFDGLNNQEKYDGFYVERMLRELSPGTLVNNRLGTPGDYETPEQFVPDRIPVKGVRIAGVNLAEQDRLPSGLPGPEDFQPWETCMTINDTWAYNKNDRNFKSTKTLIQTLVNVASKGGNFLLNVGPSPEGTIQAEFQDRLREIGKWLAVNGESIYGTTYGPLQDLPYGKTTAKGGTIYLHIFDWPQLRLEIRRMGRVASVTLLSRGESLNFKSRDGAVLIELPEQPPDPYDSVLKIEVA
jgi:alpha-L-fucosidase